MDAQAAAECSEPQRHGVAAPPPPTVEPALVVVKGVLAPHPAPIALTGPDAEPAAKRRAVRPEHEPCPPLPVLAVPAAQLHGQATSDLATACAKVAPPLPLPRHSPPALSRCPFRKHARSPACPLASQRCVLGARRCSGR